MGMDPSAGWSSLEELTEKEGGTTEGRTEDESSDEGKSSTEEADLLGREISNLSPSYSSYNYMTEEDALNKIRLLKMKIKLLKKLREESINQSACEKEIKDLTILKNNIIRNVKVVV